MMRCGRTCTENVRILQAYTFVYSLANKFSQFFCLIFLYENKANER